MNTPQIKLLSVSLLFMGFGSVSVNATETVVDSEVSYDFFTQRFLGNESTLVRDKFFNVHTGYHGRDTTPEDLLYFANEMGTGMGRDFGGPGWHANASNPEGFLNEEQAKALSESVVGKSRSHPNYDYRSKRVVTTDHPKVAFSMETAPEAYAEWTANFFEYFFDDENRPIFYEPMNEPFVHTGDFGDDAEAVRERMMLYFKAIGKEFDERGLETQVIGYASAWPSMELWDFRHWNERMKRFMDVAGPYMDAISVHIYDGTNVTGQDNRRSGANAEAILDLIETYSMMKWDEVKPHALTEYGDIVKGYPSGYSDEASSQQLKGINHLMFKFFDRQDRILISIPFITMKSSWHYNEENNYMPYGPDLWRPDPEKIVDGRVEGFLETKTIDFYRLWSDVSGERAVAYSNNPDIMVQAFVDGRHAYLCLNNLDDFEHRVALDSYSFLPDLESVRIKRLHIPGREVGIYTDEELDAAPDTVTLNPYDTVILQYTFIEPIEFMDSVQSATHYSKTYLQPIKANEPIDFSFNNLPVEDGRAVMRVSIGRPIEKSRAPELEVNGQPVPFPTNWAGYDQSNRSDFFGAIEVPVPMELIEPETTVSLRFPDDGGRVSTVVLVTDVERPMPVDRTFPDSASID